MQGVLGDHEKKGKIKTIYGFDEINDILFLCVNNINFEFCVLII